MKKRVAQWIGGVVLIAIAVLIYLILYQTHLFSAITMSTLNKHLLNPNNISVQGDLKGSILGKHFGFHQLRILANQKADTLFTANEIRLAGWTWDWDKNEFTIENLRTNQFRFNTQNLDSLKYPKSPDSKRGALIVQQFTAVNGGLVFKMKDSLQTIQIENLSADLWFIDGFTGVRVHTVDVYAPMFALDTLKLSGSVGVDIQRAINVDLLQIVSPNLNLTVNSQISDANISAHVQGVRVTPAAISNLKLPSILSDPLFDFNLIFDWDGEKLKICGPGTIYHNNAVLPFDLSSFVHSPDGESLTLMLGTELSNMHISSQRNALGHVKGIVDIFRIDLNPFIQIDKLSLKEPIGKISFDYREDVYSIATRLQTFVLNEQHFDSFTSDISYAASGKIDISKGSFTQAQNRLDIFGSVSKDSLDLRGSVYLTAFSAPQGINVSKHIEGLLTSEFIISGSPRNPCLSGEFKPVDLAYTNNLNLTGLGKYDFIIQNKVLRGDIALYGNEGSLRGDSLRSYSISAHLTDQGYEIDDFHFQGINNLISLSGRFGSKGIDINKMNIIIDNNNLRLVDTLQIRRTSDGIYKFPESVLAFNMGGIALQGSYAAESGLAIAADYEFIELAQVMDFIRIDQSFEGLASGSAQISGSLTNPIIHTKLDLLNGLTLGYPSDSAKIDLTLSSHSVISHRIDLHKSGGTLNLIGQLPWGYKVKRQQIRNTAQNFSINLDNYQLLDLKFTSIIGFPISGRATGGLSIRGTPETTKLDGQINITNATFDTLSFSKAYTDFVYEDNLLTFDSLSMVSPWGYGNGTGFMPLSLDLIAADRMAYSNRDIGIDFEYILSEMPFLSSYLSFIDGIKGDFIGDLYFRGPMLAPIRSGKIRGHNIYLELSDLGNPITDAHSEVTLLDNTLTIDHFSGRMLFSEGSTLNSQGVVSRATTFFGDLIGVKTAQNYTGVVTAKGNIDLQSFFHPYFDVNVKANEVYYRSADGMIEAIADADLKLIGQDTLDVTAVMPVKRAIYYSNFEFVEAYQQTVSQTDSSIFRYNLNTQFASDLLISNDQMEAEFEGELWLLDYGDGILRFTGTLTAREGGKFYYVGNELTIIEGEIVFQSVDFNPQLNMEAEIEIDGETVVLTLSGDMNEPELVINAENTKLTQSDVLTYLAINQKLVEVGFDTKSALNPVISYSTLLVEKELSKIGREITGLDILNVGIDLGSDTTGVSRLNRFQVGQRLSKNLIVTYEGALQPTDGESDYDFGLEYRINRNVSVTSRVNQNGEVELNGRLRFTY